MGSSKIKAQGQNQVHMNSAFIYGGVVLFKEKKQ